MKLSILAAMGSAMLLTGCATCDLTAKSTYADGNSLMGEWKLFTAQGQAIENAEMMFSAEGKMAGGNGCNRFFGDFSVQGQQLTLTPQGMTQMMCHGDALTNEKEIMEALPEVHHAVVTDHGIALQNQQGTVLLNLRR
ncbi:MAG: META domain-containing protein [Ferrimonas sp.]